MFDVSYDFKFVARKKVTGKPYMAQDRFSFRCKNNVRYTVILEEYAGDFFSIRFYLHSFEHRAKRYEILTNSFDASAVINTCLHIMAHVLKEKQQRASFGFTGAPLANETKDEPTKRFRVYKRVVENFFSPAHFVHYQQPASSTYFLVNRNAANPQELVAKITEMLAERYEF